MSQPVLSAAFGPNDPYAVAAGQQIGVNPTTLPSVVITKAPGVNSGNGILGNNTGILNNQMVTGQRRNMVPGAIQMPPIPNNRIGLNDMLIRVGGAGMEGAQQSGLQSYANMAREYGTVKDINNAAGIDAYNAQVRALQAQNKAKKNTGGNNAGALMGSIVVNDAINRGLPMVDNWTAGLGGSLLSNLAGTDAADLSKLLESVKANAGFDKLQSMREASPTGGALGQVSNTELGFLQSVFGNLEQSQSPEQLKYNLQLFQYVYNSMIHGEGNHPYAPPPGAANTINQMRNAMNAGAGGMQQQQSTPAPNVSAADAIVGVTN